MTCADGPADQPLLELVDSPGHRLRPGAKITPAVQTRKKDKLQHRRAPRSRSVPIVLAVIAPSSAKSLAIGRLRTMGAKLNGRTVPEFPMATNGPVGSLLLDHFRN